MRSASWSISGSPAHSRPGRAVKRHTRRPPKWRAMNLTARVIARQPTKNERVENGDCLKGRNRAAIFATIGRRPRADMRGFLYALLLILGAVTVVLLAAGEMQSQSSARDV